MYQLIQGNDGSGSSRTHSDPSSSCGHPWKSGGRRLTRGVNYESQLAVDEALARELQAMEDQIASATIDDNNRKEGD